MDADSAFKALADPTRRCLLQVLARQALTVSELVACLRMPQSTVSRHLRVLKDAGLVEDRREGTTARYAVAPLTNGDAAAESFAVRAVEWMRQQALPAVVKRRLDRVLLHRRDEDHSFFTRVAHRWDQMRIEAFGETFHLEAMAALLPAEWTVADIGTGTGYLLPSLCRWFRKVVAIDPVASMLDAARARCRAERAANVVFRQGDLSRLPIDGQEVDLALAALVLHHVPVPTQALGEMYRIIRPGGRLLIVEQQAHELERFRERMQDRWWGFVPATLAGEVAAAGFVSVRHRDLDSVGTGAQEAPSLFVLAAEKPPAPERARMVKNTQNETGS